MESALFAPQTGVECGMPSTWFTEFSKPLGPPDGSVQRCICARLVDFFLKWKGGDFSTQCIAVNMKKLGEEEFASGTGCTV
jgi:hypothetical protein